MKFPKINKRAGWNKAVQDGIFQKINKICCMIIRETRVAGGASPYVPPVPGHRQFSDQISVKTYVGTGSFYCEMCPRKLGHTQFEKRDSPPASEVLKSLYCKLTSSFKHL